MMTMTLERRISTSMYCISSFKIDRLHLRIWKHTELTNGVNQPHSRIEVRMARQNAHAKEITFFDGCRTPKIKQSSSRF